MPTVLITGGAKRIGAELARSFAAEGFGIALHYNSSAEEARALRDDLRLAGARCEIFQGDLCDPEAIDAVFAAARDAFGPLDMLINNASLFVNDDIASFDDALFDDHLAVNLKAPVRFARLFAAQPEPAADRLILNMLDNKLFAINPDFLTYTLSKSALLTATKMLAMRFAGTPRVCGIAPSITLISGKQSQANFEKSARINPLGRRVTPGEIAQTALFLWRTKSCNDQVMVLDGGQVLWELPRDVAFLVKEGLVDG